MLPSFLIQALFALGGVCFLLCVTIFHYFRDRVDQHLLERMGVFFASSTAEETLHMIRDGELASVLMKDFIDELFEIAAPRRRLTKLMLFFPVSGGLLILSASFASLVEIWNEDMMFVMNISEIVADTTLIIAFVLIIYCAYQLVKLTRELS